MDTILITALDVRRRTPDAVLPHPLLPVLKESLRIPEAVDDFDVSLSRKLTQATAHLEGLVGEFYRTIRFETYAAVPAGTVVASFGHHVQSSQLDFEVVGWGGQAAARRSRAVTPEGWEPAVLLMDTVPEDMPENAEAVVVQVAARMHREPEDMGEQKFGQLCDRMMSGLVKGL